jgi:hypothetical protein
MIAVALIDGPKTLAEIKEQFYAIARRFGIFIHLFEGHSSDDMHFARELEREVRELEEEGLLRREDGRFALTEPGVRKARERVSRVKRAADLARGLILPTTVSRVALFVHFILAALKIPAALLSGSVGLLNDAVDTLLDGVSSALVYLGLKFNRERAVNAVLILLMLATGAGTLYEAARRFFVPVEPEADVFAFLAAALSALACAALYAYQRFAGLRSGNLTLITQSVDSRNHIIVAGGVLAGLVASLLKFGLLDTLVGLAVAVIILKSAVELALEWLRSGEEGTVDLSRYSMGMVEKYRRFRKSQMLDWMLYLVRSRRARTLDELRLQARAALDFSLNTVLKEAGLDRQPGADETLDQCLAELTERGLLSGRERIAVTPAGEEYFNRRRRLRKTFGSNSG